MIARWISRAGGAFAFVLVGCAQPVDDVGGTAVSQQSNCANGSCSSCTTCFNMCTCGGGNVTKCTSLCSTGSGGSASGGSGGTATGGTASGGSSGFDAGVGGTSFGGTGGGSSSCNVSVGDATCNACMQASCCDAAEGCAYDSSCMGLMECVMQAPECASAVTLTELLNCGDTACPAQAVAKPLLSGYLTCLAGTCGASCGM
jgi:hypothetical protein